MKKFTGYFLACALLAFNFSCQKEEDATVTKTINVTLNVDQSYTAQVAHAGDEDDVMKITQQASHSSVSEVAAISGSQDLTFHYTPASQYIGTDEVKISSDEGSHQGGGHGNCSGHHHGGTTVYDYKITIIGSNH